jgi:phospholipid/cholesterol/gamma-HCH transport system substrate-binding protein
VRWVSRLTTVVLVLVLVGGLVTLVRSRIPSTTIEGGFHTSIKLADATRLQIGSSVMIAGVRVGNIADMTIDGKFARIDLVLRDDIQLPVDSFVTRRADSLFGDNYLEIIPGESKTLIQSGEPIAHVQEGGSTDATLRTIARTMPKIDSALDSIESFMIDRRKWVNGTVLQTTRDVDKWIADGRIEGPLASADNVMERFENGATSAAEAVSDAVPVVDRRLKNFDKAVSDARGTIKDAKQGIQNAMSDVRAGFDRADETLDDMAEVVSAVNEGRGDDWKGTIGRQLNDPGLANSIEDTTADLAEGAAGLNRFKSWIGGRMEFNIRQRSIRYYATAELWARSDRFYLVEFEKSDLGGEPFATLEEVPGSDEFLRKQEIKEKLRITAQFGKKLGPLVLRGGLKDSTAGIGADALFWKGRLKLSTDVFGSFTKTPRLKVAGAFAVFRQLYIMAGVDDALNAPGELPVRFGNTPVPVEFQTLKYGRDVFLGVGLRLTDADLTTLLRFYGTLITAYILAP